ncbi:MAG: helix-turn-helix transcriptional regulator [Verrucomicrobia bacterium]|nr:helix-turn-helix transcriptional regulator [Verrucomicrobiota bacterium]MCH8511800.1 AraC family transcriptional regulator [Kiritimatiellia bacterium]
MHAIHGPYSVHILNADNDKRFHPWEKPERRLTWYLLVMSQTGAEQIQVEGVDYEVEEGMSYLIPPGVRASLGSREGSQPVWVHFEVCWDEHRGNHPDAVPYVDDWAERSRFAQPSPMETWGVALPVMVADPLLPIFQDVVPEIVRLWKQGGSVSILRAQHELSGLLLDWVAHISESRQRPESWKHSLSSRFLTAERLARENIGGIFGVSEFAAAAGLSRSRFSVLYREHTGTPPGEYLRNLRLARAETLLRDTELPVLEVGALVGYHDPSVFGRLFRKHRGMTPSEWRDLQRKG